METIGAFVHSLGGPVVACLLLLSVVACAIILFRLWQRLRHGFGIESVSSQALQHLQNEELKEALLLTRNRRHPRLQSAAATLAVLNQHPQPEDIHLQEIRRLTRTALLPLFSGLRPLEVIATVAPLLGLFGTVLGMIEAFRAMESAGAQVDPSVLSGGIWQALLTTAYGLAVAIPVSLLHSAFERQTEKEVIATQNLMEQLLFLHAQSGAPTLSASAISSHTNPELTLAEQQPS